MAPELDMTPAGLLLNAYHRGGDVEAVLDQVDCREAAAGLAWIVVLLADLDAVPVDVAFTDAKSKVIARHMARALEAAA